MQEIERIVRKYGQTRNITDLQTYISEIDIDELKLIIRKHIRNADFSTFWHYLLQGLDIEDSYDKRYDVISACINEIKERDLNTQHANSIITRLCMELPKFSTKHLISLCVLCMGFIKAGDVSETCWREMLPEVMNVIIEKPCVEYNLSEMSGLEFKTQYINALCMHDWSGNIIIPLAMMFIEMPLSKDEHKQITYKLVSYIERLTSQEIPSFVYQILRFCQNQHSKLIFHKLQQYFGLKIYNNAFAAGDNSSESVISDAINEDVIQAESMVLYHIYQSALLGHESIKDYLGSLKNLTKSPEFILHPFQLTVLLTISSVAFYEDKVFELIRQTISRHYREEMKKNECHWLRTLVPNTLNLQDKIMKILQNSLNDRDLVIQGLVNLGFVLLGVGALMGRELLMTKRQWNLGKFILLNLVKEKHHMAPTILQKLCNYIVIGNNITQYIDCFRDFSVKFTFITLENKSCIIELMETLVNVPESCAETIFDIVIPLTKTSPTLRDHLILLLRKALYSRSTETRQIAVQGFLKILVKLKISNLTALSQISSSGSSSGHSILTQISLHRSGYNSQQNAFSNEALCLEILNILKRCYMQQADVRCRLYTGLNDVVKQNPDLALPILTLLWSHFLKYYNEGRNTLPPVDFAKLLSIRDTEIVMQEPISRLISAISFLIVKIQELGDESANTQKFIDVFESLCKRLIKCELVHFELDDGTSLVDILPESKKKVATLKEAMSLYESLIGYKIWSWNRSSQNHAQQIISLFQGYFRLQHYAKDVSKSKKKKDSNKNTQQNQTPRQTLSSPGQAQTSQDRRGRQDESLIKNPKAVQIKLPTTVLGFKVLIKFLSLLHENNVNWATSQEANLLKVKHDIHQHVMQAVTFQLQQISTSKSAERHKEYYLYCRDIAKIIYPRCIDRLEDFVEFDVTTAALAVECFNIILTIVTTNYCSELKSFLCIVGNHDSDNELLVNLMPFIIKFQKFLALDDNVMDDLEFKRISEAVINVLSVLISHIPVNQEPVKNIEWMKNFAAKHTLKSKNVARLFAKLWFSTYIKHSSLLSTFETVTENVCEILGSVSSEDDIENLTKLTVIDELTVSVFMETLTNSIKFLLENIEWMISRLRSEYEVLTYVDEGPDGKDKEKLSDKERSVSCQLCLILNLIEGMCDIRVTVGLSKTVIENVLVLYNTLNSLARYFIVRSSKLNPAYKNARFEQVIKLQANTKRAWHKLLLFIVQNQTEDIENIQAKKKNSTSLKNKVLNETKLLPKVVFAIEQFSKFIIQLSNKTKENLSKYDGPGTSRDFRIVKDAIDKNKSLDETESDNETTTGLSTVYEEGGEDDDDDEGSPSKKPRH